MIERIAASSRPRAGAPDQFGVVSGDEVALRGLGVAA
jgi:hypothetical protein